MREVLRLVPAVSALLALVACSSGGGGGGGSTTGEIGPAGGTLSVTSGALNGLTLTVPPNALASTVTISVNSVATPNLAGFVPVGTAARFGPAGTQFAPAATLQIGFDPNRIPAGRTTNDLIVKRQDAGGTVTDLTITNVDTNANVITAQVPAFSIIWPVVPDPMNIEWPFATLWPLNNGDRYVYDEDYSIDVFVGRFGAPGLPLIDLIEVSINEDSGRYGVWLSKFSDQTTQRHGDFQNEFGDNSYRVNNPALFAPATVTNGAMVAPPPYSADVYESPGTTPIDTGTLTYTGTFTRVGSLRVPAGTFENVYRWDIDETWVDSTGSDSSQSSFWLAPDVGPIQYRIDGLTRRLTSYDLGSAGLVK